ncbi:MAG: ion transporter [Rhodospirillales bacterium]|nr:ion transporter [Rhodospirillales bacterium]
MPRSFRKQVYEFLEPQGTDNRPGTLFARFMVFLIVTNVVAIILESIQEVHDAHSVFFTGFELISIIIFSAEYMARVWSAPEDPVYIEDSALVGRWRYAITPLALVDLIAILPFYLAFFVVIDLRFMRVFRLLRLFKLTRYSPALATVGAVLVAQRRQLGAALVIMLTLLVFSSSVAYLLEKDAQPEYFGSIPHSMWWTMATLTTVGFGDVTPITPLGKIFGTVLMVLGVGMYALPAGILASGFAHEFKKREFAVTWRMVASIPVFADLDAITIADISGILRPVLVPAHYTIVHRGDAADAMYFVVMGEVVVDLHPTPRRLSQGDFFGEIALLENRKRTVSVSATTECQLLALDREAFLDLVDRLPKLKEYFETVAVQRLNEVERQGNLY